MSSASSISSSSDSGEKDSKPSVILLLKLEGVGVAVISERPQELIYLSLSNIEVELTDSPASTEIEAKMADMQVDNMLFKAVFPNVIYRSLPRTEQEKVPRKTKQTNKQANQKQTKICPSETNDLFFVVVFDSEFINQHPSFISRP